MRTLAVLTASGLVTWMLRVAFIGLAPAKWRPRTLGGLLRHAAPAAFAALAAAAVSTTAAGDGSLSGWPVVAATATTLLLARRSPHPLLTLMIGAVAATVFAAL
ncbi:MAG: AzlD domain-containing protein [Nocardioides sp.]